MSAWVARQRRAVLAAALAVLAQFRCAPAAAQAGEESGQALVLVRAEPCAAAPYDAAALLRLLDLELGGLSLRAAPLPGAAAEAEAAAASALGVVSIACGAEPGKLALRVDDFATGKRLERELQVEQVSPEARPRALALALATLLETSLHELTARDSDPDAVPVLAPTVEQALRARLLQRLAPAPAPVQAEGVAVPAAAPAPLRAAFDAGLALRTFPGRSTGLVGLRGGAAPALARALRLPLHIEALYGHSDLADDAGKIGVAHLVWLAGGAGLGLVVPGAPELEIGPRLLAGYALAAAEAERAGASTNSESGFVLAGLLSASARFGAAEGTCAVVGLDLGYAPLGVVFLGDQARLSGMADVTFGVHAGASFR